MLGVSDARTKSKSPLQKYGLGAERRSHCEHQAPAKAPCGRSQCSARTNRIDAHDRLPTFARLRRVSSRCWGSTASASLIAPAEYVQANSAWPQQTRRSDLPAPSSKPNADVWPLACRLPSRCRSLETDYSAPRYARDRAHVDAQLRSVELARATGLLSAVDQAP